MRQRHKGSELELDDVFFIKSNDAPMTEPLHFILLTHLKSKLIRAIIAFSQLLIGIQLLPLFSPLSLKGNSNAVPQK